MVEKRLFISFMGFTLGVQHYFQKKKCKLLYLNRQCLMGKGAHSLDGFVLHIFEELSKCLQIEREKIRKAVHGTEKKCAEHRGTIWELGGKARLGDGP